MPHIAEAAARWQNWLGDDEQELAWPFTAMARFYEGQGAYSQAEPWYEQCLAAVCDRFGEDPPDVAASLNNLAGLYESQGRYEQAEPLYLGALQIFLKRLGQDHPNTQILRSGTNPRRFTALVVSSRVAARRWEMLTKMRVCP